MTLKGRVSSIEPEGTRVVFPDYENSVSKPLKKASHVPELIKGDNVAVVFFSGYMDDGLIIAKF